MKKMVAFVISKLAVTGTIGFLLLALYLNLSTLWAVGEIKRGRSVEFGYFSAVIGSGSMEPDLSVNDLLLVKGGGVVKVDDIITYVSPQGSLITHRVIEVFEDSYFAQGDANNVPDEKISGQRVLGKVIYIFHGAGSIVEKISSPVGVIFLMGMTVLVWLIQRIWRRENEENQGSKKKISDDKPEKPRST